MGVPSKGEYSSTKVSAGNYLNVASTNVSSRHSRKKFLVHGTGTTHHRTELVFRLACPSSDIVVREGE